MSECTRCGRVFAYPWKLKRHLQRKTPCTALAVLRASMSEKKLSTLTCERCRRVFTRASNKQRHARSGCPYAPVPASSSPLPHEFGLGRIHIAEAKERHTTVDSSEATASFASTRAPPAVPTDVPDQRSKVVNINVFGQGDLSRAVRVLRSSLRIPQGPQGPSLSELRGRAHKDVLTGLFLYGGAEHPEGLTALILDLKSGSTMLYVGERRETSRLRGSMYIPVGTNEEEPGRAYDVFKRACALVREHLNPPTVSTSTTASAAAPTSLCAGEVAPPGQ